MRFWFTEFARQGLHGDWISDDHRDVDRPRARSSALEKHAASPATSVGADPKNVEEEGESV